MKIIRWMLLNGAVLALLWCGLVLDMAGPRNVGLFAVWYVSVISLVTCSDDIIKKLAAKPEFPSVPGWIDGTFDLLLVGLLVWFGRWWSGSAYALHILMCMALREKVKKIRSTSNKELEQQQ